MIMPSSDVKEFFDSYNDNPTIGHWLYILGYAIRKEEFPDLMTSKVDSVKKELEKAFRERGYGSIVEDKNPEKWVTILPVDEKRFLGRLGTSTTFEIFYFDDVTSLKIGGCVDVEKQFYDIIDTLVSTVGRKPEIQYTSEGSFTYEWVKNPNERISKLEVEALSMNFDIKDIKKLYN